MAVSKKDLMDAIRKKSRDDRISCKVALTLAANLGVTPKRVGKACDEMKIRISFCQLGCFV